MFNLLTVFTIKFVVKSFTVKILFRFKFHSKILFKF